MADSQIASAVDSVELKRVGESWSQTNRDAYAWTQVPTARVLDSRSGRNNSTVYSLPSLENALIASGGLIDLAVGEEIPPPAAIGETDVTVTVVERGIRSSYSRPTSRPAAHRLADVENGFGGVIMTELFGGIEQDLVSFVTSATNYGSGFAFSGTGALDTYASDQTPDQDIEDQLRSMRKYAAIPGMEMWCIMEHRVLDILRGHPNYVGAGEGSNSAKFMDRDAFLSRFMAAHRLDKIIVTSAVGNNAKYGQTASLREIAHEVLWFGVVDVRQAAFDLTNEGSDDFVDGGLCIAVSREPEILSGLQGTLKEVELFYGKTAFKIFNPRGTAFGAFAASGEIFT